MAKVRTRKSERSKRTRKSELSKRTVQSSKKTVGFGGNSAPGRSAAAGDPVGGVGAGGARPKETRESGTGRGRRERSSEDDEVAAHAMMGPKLANRNRELARILFGSPAVGTAAADLSRVSLGGFPVFPPSLIETNELENGYERQELRVPSNNPPVADVQLAPVDGYWRDPELGEGDFTHPELEVPDLADPTSIGYNLRPDRKSTPYSK